MKPLKTKVSITLDTDLIETIKVLAEQDDRSFSQYINLVLKDFIKNQTLSMFRERLYYLAINFQNIF